MHRVSAPSSMAGGLPSIAWRTRRDQPGPDRQPAISDRVPQLVVDLRDEAAVVPRPDKDVHWTTRSAENVQLGPLNDTNPALG